MSEEWKPISSCPGYAASSAGRISGPSGRPLKLYKNSFGYLQVAITVGSHRKSRKVHRLVTEAFHGQSELSDACHIDGSKANNKPENLMWATRAVNISHKVLHGTMAVGEAVNGAKLTEAQVRQIRASSKTYVQLAAEYGVSKVSIWEIRARRTWTHI